MSEEICKSGPRPYWPVPHPQHLLVSANYTICVIKLSK